MAFGSQLGSFEQVRIPCYLNPQVEWWDFLDIFGIQDLWGASVPCLKEHS